VQAIALDLDAVLADTRPLWRDWLKDVARRTRVELDVPEDRAAAAGELDELLGDWRPLLERFAADRGPVSPPSPGQSFWGTCGSQSAVGCTVANETTSWGPGLGWYLSIAAAVLFVAALVPVVWWPKKRAVTHEAAGLGKDGLEITHEGPQDIAKLSPTTRIGRGPVRIADMHRLETPTHSLEPRLDWVGTPEARLGAIFSRSARSNVNVSRNVVSNDREWNLSSLQAFSSLPRQVTPAAPLPSREIRTTASNSGRILK